MPTTMLLAFPPFPLIIRINPLGGDTVSHNLIVFGIIVGAFMTMGLLGIPGILARIDTMESLPWYLGASYLGFLGTYVLYPIWTIWLGRILLFKKYVP